MASESVKSGLSMGENTLTIPMELFALNRERLVKRLKEKQVEKGAVVLLQSGHEVPWDDTDVSYVFKQESYFMWAFGALESNCYGLIEVDTGKARLFVPRIPESHGVWLGRSPTIGEICGKYQIETVYTDRSGINSDSGFPYKAPHFDGIDQFNVNDKILYEQIADLRVIKCDLELEVIKYVVAISSAAHRKVMRNMAPFKIEYQCEAEFLHYVYSVGGCRHVSYTCICAGGPNSAVLHYGHAAAPNNRQLKPGDMCCFDMGANYFGYCADITCSFPVSGKFSPEQKIIYEMVLDANLAVAAAARPGVTWADMHILAIRTLLTQLKSHGFVQGDVEEMIAAGVGSIFQPHGLGHLLGLDVHDVGGYLSDCPPRASDPPGMNSLRTARVLKEGMVLTIEPGCYFIDSELEKSLRNPKLAKYLVPDVINKYRQFGGVRIEDDVVVTATGVVNLTKVPRTVQEIEDWMAGRDLDDKYL